MAIYAEQLPSGKWGIYASDDDTPNDDAALIATVACETTCATIMANLKSGRRDAPANDLNQLYQVPELTGRLKHKHTETPAKKGHQRPAVSPRKTRKRRAKSKAKPALKTPELTSQPTEQTTANPLPNAPSSANPSTTHQPATHPPTTERNALKQQPLTTPGAAIAPSAIPAAAPMLLN